MADHKREQIMSAVTSTLTGLTTTGANVTRGRVYSEDETKVPALFIYQGPDNPIEADDDDSVYHHIDSNLTVNIEAAVKDNESLDTTLNLINKEVVVALFADITQGVAGVINTAESIIEEPELSAASNKPIATMLMQFVIHYRRSRSDPSA